MTDARSFGEMLKDARSKRQITLRKLGGIIGIAPGYLSEIETGRKLPPKEANIIENLAVILNIDKKQLQESAKVVRATHGSKIFDKIIGTDGELAWGFYRATENTSEEELRTALKEFLADLNSSKEKT